MLPITDNHLFHCSSKTDAIQASQQANFSTLDVRLQGFVKLVGQGETRMAALLSQETTNVKDHVTVKADELGHSLGQISRDNQQAYREISQATAEVDANVIALTRRTNDKDDQYRKDARHDRLLKSLKYQTMNERRNQIEHPHTETFEWIFGGAPASAHQLAGKPQSEFDGDFERIRKATVAFIEWARDPSSPTFWISGKPGSGKSTLMKFLAENPRTLELLDSASPAASRTAVLSHYIWSAGQPIEATVKGLLCSILHQMLLEQNDCEAVLERHPGTRMKDSVSDWSEKELQAVLFETSSELGRPLCLFIDGLDEISPPDGQFRVLDIIKALSRAPAVKTCVSSRPEPTFQRSLSRCPMFRVQDLTRFDIERFAAHTLKTAFEGSYLNSGDKDLTCDWIQLRQLVCEMAEGVFLWVALAVRSLKAGLVKGDGPKELHRRLRALPSDLATLYSSMWDRLGDEKEIYQRDAARYFNLMWTESDASFVMEVPHVRHNTLVMIQLAYDRSLSQRVLKDYNDSGRPIAYGTLSHHLNRQKIVLEARCAGLVEIRKNRTGHIELAKDDPNGRPSLYADKLFFIHRSARDFLLHQSGPERLLDKDDTTVVMRLSSIALAHLAACCFEGDLFSRRADQRLELVIGLVSRILRTPSGGTSPVPHQLLTECGRLLGRAFRRSLRSQPCRHHDFGAILSWCLPIELLKTAFLPMPRGFCKKHTAYLFITAMGSIKYRQGLYFPGTNNHEAELPPPALVDWLCEIAQMVDLDFQRVVCPNLFRMTVHECFEFNAPQTPLSATIQCLQTWTSHWERWGESGIPPRYNMGIHILTILRSLLTGSSGQEHLSYSTIIAIRTPTSGKLFSSSQTTSPAKLSAPAHDLMWELVPDIEELDFDICVRQYLTPLVVVKTSMRLAVCLLAADMRRWGQEDLCGLLLHQLGESAPFDIKVTEILTTRGRDTDAALPLPFSLPGRAKGSRCTTTICTPQDLLRIENIFGKFLASAQAGNPESCAGTCSQPQDLLQELYGLVQEIQDSDDRGSTLEDWQHVRARWVQDGTFWKRDDPRALPPEGDVLGKMYSSWVEEGDSEEDESEKGDSEAGGSEEGGSGEDGSEKGGSDGCDT